MKPMPFLKPRIVGRRFDEHSIPLEFMKDFAALEEMVIEVAKWKFLEIHGDRKRVPPGFATEISLTLSDVTEGSAIPTICLLFSGLTHPHQGYYEAARDSIVNAIAAASANTDVLEHLPGNALVYFDRFGRSLREGESIEFDRGAACPAMLTREIRRKLILASDMAGDFSESIVLYGRIPEADQRRQTFDFEAVDGKLYATTPIAPQHRQSILDAFNGYESGQRVQIQGVGRFNSSNKLQRIESVEHITAVEAMDIAARLQELANLEKGWFDGSGESLSTVGLEWLEIQMQQHFLERLPLPRVFPTPTGGVQFEWSIGAHEISLEIDLATKLADLHDLNLKTGAEKTGEINLQETISWRSIADCLDDAQRSST